VGVAWLITSANVILERVTHERAIVAEGDLAAFLAFFFGFCVLLYAVRWVPLPLGTTASLPFFNGISVMLGVFFTGAWLSVAPDAEGTLLEPAVAAAGTSLAMLLGCFLGWFNVAILFRQSESPSACDERASRSGPPTRTRGLPQVADMVGALSPAGGRAPVLAGGYEGYQVQLLGGSAGSHSASVWIWVMSSSDFSGSSTMGSPTLPSSLNGV
jgi:hypothetical protein